MRKLLSKSSKLQLRSPNSFQRMRYCRTAYFRGLQISRFSRTRCFNHFGVIATPATPLWPPRTPLRRPCGPSDAPATPLRQPCVKSLLATATAYLNKLNNVARSKGIAACSNCRRGAAGGSQGRRRGLQGRRRGGNNTKMVDAARRSPVWTRL